MQAECPYTFKKREKDDYEEEKKKLMKKKLRFFVFFYPFEIGSHCVVQGETHSSPPASDP